MRKIKHLFFAFNILIVLCTALAFTSPLVHPEKSTIPGLMGLLFPLLLIINALFIAVWVSIKQWYFLLSLGILVVGWNSISTFVQIGSLNEPSQATLTVATYNVFQFNNIGEKETRTSALKHIISDLGSPDILCLQEAPGADKMLTGLNYEYTFRIGGSLSYILSRYPIVRSEELNFDGEHSLSGWAEIAISGDTIRLYLLYLTSSRVTAETEHLIEDARIQDRQTWLDIQNLLGKYSRASVHRARQADVIAEHVAQSPYPVIIAGDLNDIPQSYTYARIAAGMTDSFISCGHGMGTTYGGVIPGLRIDYIIADPAFEFVSHVVPHLSTSDHFPVIAQIRIPDL